MRHPFGGGRCSDWWAGRRCHWSASTCCSRLAPAVNGVRCGGQMRIPASPRARRTHRSEWGAYHGRARTRTRVSAPNRYAPCAYSKLAARRGAAATIGSPSRGGGGGKGAARERQRDREGVAAEGGEWERGEGEAAGAGCTRITIRKYARLSTLWSLVCTRHSVVCTLARVSSLVSRCRVALLPICCRPPYASRPTRRVAEYSLREFRPFPLFYEFYFILLFYFVLFYLLSLRVCPHPPLFVIADKKKKNYFYRYQFFFFSLLLLLGIY